MHRILRFTESCDVARFSGVSRPKNLDTPPETRTPQKRRGAGDGDSKAEEQVECGLGARELERLEAGEGSLQRQGSLVHAGCEGAGSPNIILVLHNVNISMVGENGPFLRYQCRSPISEGGFTKGITESGPKILFPTTNDCPRTNPNKK